jgi:DNA ligase-1
MQLPTLYKKTKTGKIQEWTIRTDSDEDPTGDAMWGVILTRYGQSGGKMQETVDVVREGKNVGRANATSAVEQAEAEARSRWEKKLKSGYVENLDSAEAGEVHEVIRGGRNPMLAYPYDKQGHKIKYPALAQPKLDGHRCVAILEGGKCTLWSRTRKRITGVPHIERAIEAAFSRSTEVTLIFDGELYNHDLRDNFEGLTSLIRSQSPKPGHERVQYWIYDMISDGTPQALRAAALAHLHLDPPLVVVPTEEVADEEEMVRVFGAYLANGFEGLMLRNKGAMYQDRRSYDLQKVKLMADAEFEVVRVEEGRGRMAGLALFVCRTEEGKEFRVKMEGELEALRKYVEDPSLAVGRMLTVRYQNLTNEGLPRFPVGVRFREDV